MKKSSIEFTKKNQSVTYLVFSVIGGRLLGYFSLALKPLTVKGETVSNTVKRKLLLVSEFDKRSNTYTMSAYLIAQIGKNFSENEGKLLSFYRNNRFSQFDTRQTTSNTDKPNELVQLLRLL